MNVIDLFRSKTPPPARTLAFKIDLKLSDEARGECAAKIRFHEKSMAAREKEIKELLAKQRDERTVLGGWRAQEAFLQERSITEATKPLANELSLDADIVNPDISTAIADAPEEMREAAE